MEKIVATNKKARYEYHILETYEAGIALKGTEVKSLRAGQASLKEAYARVENGEAMIHGLHIAPYAQGNIANHEPKRPRKLLLHKREIMKLLGKTQERGLTLVPLKIYFRDGRAKLELALARGKAVHDKRRDIAEREARREIEREIKERSK